MAVAAPNVWPPSVTPAPAASPPAAVSRSSVRWARVGLAGSWMATVWVAFGEVLISTTWRVRLGAGERVAQIRRSGEPGVPVWSSSEPAGAARVNASRP